MRQKPRRSNYYYNLMQNYQSHIGMGNRFCKNISYPKYHSKNFPKCLIRYLRQGCLCNNQCVNKTIKIARTRFRRRFRKDCGWDLKNLFNFEEFVDCTHFEEGEAVGLPDIYKTIENATTQEIVINYLHKAEKSYNRFCEKFNKPNKIRFNQIRCAKSLIISISGGNGYVENSYYEYLRVLTKCIPERFLVQMWTQEYLYEDKYKRQTIPAIFSIFITPIKIAKTIHWKSKIKNYKSIALVGNKENIKQYSTFPEKIESRIEEVKPNTLISGKISLSLLTVLFLIILGLISALSKTKFKTVKFYILLFLITLFLIGQVILINI